MIHPHGKRKHNRLGMNSLAEIHSLPCSIPQTLGTTAGYSLHRKATQLPSQKPFQLLPSETCWALMSSELQLPSDPVPTFSKARNAAVVSLLTGWGFMASPALKMRAASPDIQSSTLSSNGHWPASVSPLSWSPLAWRRRPDGLTLNPWYRSLVWDATVVDTFALAGSHYIVISAAIPGSVASDAETDKCQKYNDLLDTYYFQPVAIETTGVYGKSTAPFLNCLAKKLVYISATPGSYSGSTSACLWPWSEGTPPAYWSVCKFDLILATLSATSVPARHLPLFNE